jgi:hypothetical protein
MRKSTVTALVLDAAGLTAGCTTTIPVAVITHDGDILHAEDPEKAADFASKARGGA